jgi:ATP-binding cassette subfamily B protein
MSLYFYSFFVFGQLSLFGTVVKNYQEAKANHEILQEIIAQEPEPSDLHLTKLDAINTMEINDVSFAYNEEKEILHHISASWKAGQSVAFVGPSGSGKSTILKLLCGLYQPDSGQMLINHIPTTKLNLTAFKQQIGVVSQDAQLFSGSIRENLLFVSPQAMDEDINTVIQQASLGVFITELPQ